MGTVPVPYVPVAGDDATQARVLTWADAATYLLGSTTSGGSRKPLAVLRQSVAQSFTNLTAAAVTFDIEDDDYDNGHSTSTNTDRYTVQTAGYYDLSAVLIFASNATGFRSAWMQKVGVSELISSRSHITAIAGDVTTVHISTRKIRLAVGDAIQVVGQQNSGGALNSSVASPLQSSLHVEWRSN